VQALVGVTVDGKIGPQTIAAINATDPKWLFDHIRLSRIAFVEAIVRNKPSLGVFLAGWKNRINALKFTA
jgi:lysozyme family protein